MYQKLLELFFRHRRIVISIAAIIWLLAVYSASGLKLDENIMDLLPDKDERISAYREIYDKFNPMNSIFIDVALTKNSKHLDLLISTADSIHNNLEKSQYFTKIIYRWQIRDLQKALNVLAEYRSVLFTKEDSIVIQSKLNESYIRERIQQWKRAMLETPSPFLAELYIKDPLDFNSILQKKLSSFQVDNENITIYQGRLFNKAKNHVLIIAQPKFKNTDTGNGRELINFLDNQFRDQEKKTQNQIDVSYLSAHRFSIENANRIQADIQRTVSIALVAIIILSLLIYSRPILMVLTLLPALFGSTFALGTLRIFDPVISAIIIGSGAMLIGITVDYGIHFLYHLDQGNSLGKDIIGRLLKPLVLSAGTTIIAFIALQFSDLPGYRQLSWFVVLGILGSVLFVIFILPFFTKSTSKLRKPVLPVQNIFPILFEQIARHRKSVFVLLAVLTALAIPGFLKVDFDGDVQNLNAISPGIKSDMQKIKNEYGNILSSTFLIIQAENLDDALQENQRIYQKVKNDISLKPIQLSKELISLLPSKQKQDENQTRWQNLFNIGQIEQLSSILKKETIQAGIKENVFNPFLDRLPNKSGYVTFEKYQNTLIGTILNNIVHLDSNRIDILTNIQFKSEKDLKALTKIIQEKGANAFIYDGKSFVNQIVNLILLELEHIGFIAFILVLVFISISVRNFKSLLVIIIPLLISIFWTFSILGWAGIKINIINSIITVFIFGLVIDYSIFLVSSFKNHKESFIHTSSGAILISALTTMIGLGALVLAGHPALHSLGLTALIGISSGLIGVLLLIPAVLTNIFKDNSV